MNKKEVSLQAIITLDDKRYDVLDLINGLTNRCIKYENVIEEIREYIEENAFFMYKDNEEVLDRVSIEGLLDILNKVNEMSDK